MTTALAYNQTYRAKKKAEGICHQCGTAPVCVTLKGTFSTRCRPCLRKANPRRQQAREARKASRAVRRAVKPAPPPQTRQEAAQCKETWWIGLDRAAFYDRCQAEQARMQQSEYRNTTFGRGIEGSGA